MTDPAIAVEAIAKSYGDVTALGGVDLEMPRGQVFGLLGPNGAGKTTLVRILTTLLKPDSGRARVLGRDVVEDAAELRSLIGLAGQSAAVDEPLTGWENLEMVGRLYGLTPDEAHRRAETVLERIDLVEAASRPVRTYSGGMRRRLDLAASLVGQPEVLMMDEPTTGLDPSARLELWTLIEELVAEGTTLLLTTQYLEEADRLADLIAVIDHGQVISEGTPDQLKDQMGGDVLDMTFESEASAARGLALLAGLGTDDPARFGASVHLPIGDDHGAVLRCLRVLEENELELEDLAMHKPTLDDVFLKLTGHRTSEADEEPEPAGTRRAR